MGAYEEYFWFRHKITSGFDWDVSFVQEVFDLLVDLFSCLSEFG